MKHWIKTLSILCITVGVFIPSWVHALTFTPDRIDSNVVPGVSHVQELTLFNETGEPITVSLTSTPLEILDAAAGIATFPNHAQSLDWLTVTPGQFVLEPGEKRTVVVTMLVPDDASGSLIAGITGPFVFVEVDADSSTREGTIESVTPIGGSLLSRLPVTLEVSFANTGNVHLRPVGTLEVRNLFGKLVAQESINDTALTVLPATSRSFQVTWGRTAKESTSPNEARSWKTPVGPYRLTVEMTAGERTDTRHTVVWIVPWRALVLLGTILGLGWLIRRRTRRVRL